MQQSRSSARTYISQGHTQPFHMRRKCVCLTFESPAEASILSTHGCRRECPHTELTQNNLKAMLIEPSHSSRHLASQRFIQGPGPSTLVGQHFHPLDLAILHLQQGVHCNSRHLSLQFNAGYVSKTIAPAHYAAFQGMQRTAA